MNNLIEQWKPIPSAPGYEASNFGRIRSCLRTILTANGQLRTYKSVILTPVKQCRGYVAVAIGHGKAGRLVHRLVLEAFRGPCPSGMESRHLNGVKTYNYLENLKWGTPLENGEDRIRHGTTVKTMAKLTPKSVRHIRQMLASGKTQREAGSVYGVNQGAVSSIALRQTWKDVR